MVARVLSLPSSRGGRLQGGSRQDHLYHRQGRPAASPDDSSITSSRRPAVTLTDRLSAVATASEEEEETLTRTTTAAVMTTAAVRTSLPVINEGAVVTLRHYIDLATSQNFSNSWNKCQQRDQRSDSDDNRSNCSDRAATPPSPSNHFRQAQQQLQQQVAPHNGDCSTSPSPMTTTLALLPAKLRQESSSTLQPFITPRQSIQTMPAIAQHPASASSSTQRPVFSRSGSGTDQSLPAIAAATQDASTRRESNSSSTAVADAAVVKAFERPRLISVEDQPWNGDHGRQHVTLGSANSSSMAAGTVPTTHRDHLVSTGTDWSVFDDDLLHHHQCQQQRVESAGDRMDLESDRAMQGGSAPAESAMEVVTAECSARLSTVAAASTNISKSTSRVNNPVRKTSKGSDAVFTSISPERLTRSNRTVSVSNLSKMSGDGPGAGQTGAGVVIGGGGWRRGRMGSNVTGNGTNIAATSQLQRHRSELNVNRVGYNNNNITNNSIQRSPYAQTNFARPRQTTTLNATPRKDVDAQLTSTNRSRQGLVKSSSQPILRRETTYGNLQRLNNTYHQRQVPLRAAAAADDDDDDNGSGDGDEPTETDKRQRIVEWLDGVDEDAERPPSPEIVDEPPQTDTAIHIVYGGD